MPAHLALHREGFLTGPELVPCSAKNIRKKNYNKVLKLLGGDFILGTHALLY